MLNHKLAAAVVAGLEKKADIGKLLAEGQELQRREKLVQGPKRPGALKRFVRQQIVNPIKGGTKMSYSEIQAAKRGITPEAKPGMVSQIKEKAKQAGGAAAALGKDVGSTMAEGAKQIGEGVAEGTTRAAQAVKDFRPGTGTGAGAIINKLTRRKQIPSRSSIRQATTGTLGEHFMRGARGEKPTDYSSVKDFAKSVLGRRAKKGQTGARLSNPSEMAALARNRQIAAHLGRNWKGYAAGGVGLLALRSALRSRPRRRRDER